VLAVREEILEGQMDEDEGEADEALGELYISYTQH